MPRQALITRQTVLAALGFGILAFAGNMAGIELFFNLHLHFGTLFVMVALLRFGPAAGLIAGLAGGVALWIDWGHPWIVLALVGEAAFVGWMLRRSSNVVLYTTVYWLLVGMPVVALLQLFILKAELSYAILVMLKLGLNGVLMALFAALLFHLAALFPNLRPSLRHAPRMHDVLVTSIVAAILIPGICYVVLDIRRELKHEEDLMRQRIEVSTEMTREFINTWLQDKIHDVETLAALVGDPQRVPASVIQARADIMKRMSPHFLTMSVQNDRGISVAFVPQFDKHGKSNVGKDYSTMPYYAIERETLRPAVSNVDFGTAVKVPRVALFAPVVNDGIFRGYCTGVIEVGHLVEQLKIIGNNNSLDVTLVDRKRQVIASTDRKLQTMDRLERFQGGELQWLQGKVYRLVPPEDLDAGPKQWRRATFGMDSLLTTDVPWSIVISAPVQPFMVKLHLNASRGFSLLFVLTLFSFGAAQAASAAFVRPVTRLRRVTAALPVDIINHQEIDWPTTGIQDIEGLIINTREMAKTLHDYVDELQTLNESLEQRVLERTEELRASEERTRAIFMEAGIGIVVCDDSRRILDVNPAMVQMIGYSRDELIGKTIGEISHPDDEALNISVVKHTLEAGLDVFRMEKRYIRKDGSVVWGNLTVSFLKEDSGTYSRTIAMVEDISDRKRAEEEIRQLAYFDSLTTLPNRTLFQDRLQQALARAERQKSMLALLYLDLDRFKDVNDTMGHGYGDLLLARVARRLETSVRRSDTFARLGGDEFVIIINDCRDEQGAAHLADHILEQMNAPFDLEGREVFISTSIGIVVYPADGDDALKLQKHADMALYAAKDSGGSSYVFFSPEMNRKALDRRIMEDALRHALQNNEMFLEYQPLVDLHSGRVFSVEALLRWSHPVHGLIAPDRFIPVAEEIGLIRKVGEWVLRTACRQAVAWQQAGLPPMQVAVNVSGYQFNQPTFVEVVDAVLAETGLPAPLLELELTESALMEGKRDTVATLDTLKARGLRMAIDDFGTGYSSLSYLKHFPIDRLKIDRSFIRDIASVHDDRAIVQAIIAMSHTLGMRVLAEGVEREEELELLKTWGCDEAQGYLFSRPLPAGEVERFILDQGTITVQPAVEAALRPELRPRL